MTGRHSKEGGNHLEQESVRQKATEGTDGGLRHAIERKILGERSKVKMYRVVAQLVRKHGY